MDEYIGQIYEQHCGDVLKVLEKTDKQKDKKYLYLCTFLKYPVEVLVLPSQFKRGVVNNPQIERVHFVDRIWKQHCGDELKILGKSKNMLNGAYLWRAQFLKYPHIIEAPKQSIQLGLVNNPMILEFTFIGHIFEQHCGCDLKVIEPIKKDGKTYYKVEFLDPYYETIAQKSNILNGEVYNYALDQFVE